MRLKGRVAIVTGSSRGIGKGLALALAREGADMVIAALVEQEDHLLSSSIYSTAEEIQAMGTQALAIETDVSNEQSVQEMVRQTINKFGRIDILVNNAGAFPAKTFTPFYEINVDEWDRIMAVNLRGMLLCCKAVFPHMKTQGKGKIINISSTVAWVGLPFRSSYATSKAGILGFTASIAKEVGEYGINVNAITPGFTEIERTKKDFPTDFAAEIVKEQAIKRLGKPEDLAGTVIFLASDDSDFVTGQAINVDGGRYSH